MKDDPKRIESIFTECLLQPDDAGRAAFLAGACANDDRVFARVTALLRAHDEAADFLDNPPAILGSVENDTFNPSSDWNSTLPLRGPAALEVRPGTTIGRYKLLEQIGEGGFGVVYMAEQESPVRRRVALKVIKAGMDTRNVIARFEAERQALAMMNHPNIASVLDVGATDTGRPYFVMELVKGVPITDYCDQANLATRERLELFMDVCRAVQHAHQKGIIHRDLKPSNIMITLRDERPNVKVIDFGIAKATEQKLTEKTLFTHYGQMIGTPAYMSPEQAVMSEFDVDTRSDVYSLGVLLYELLAGSPPFDAQTLRKAGFDEMRRIIREQSPPKPSTKLNTLAQHTKHTVAAHRRATPQALGKQLYGDLDWIVLKAIEKDRTRRYESAGAFAQDIERHLKSEPVIAGAPGRIYKLRRFAQRHKAALTVAVIIAVSLMAGTVLSSWQALRATRAGRAELQQRIAAQDAHAQAVTSQQKAEWQQHRADMQKGRAEEQLARAERLLYASKLMLAQDDFEAGYGALTLHYLDECQSNLRGWEYRYLRNRITSGPVLTGHTNSLSSAVFSPDGTRIVTGGEDGTAKVWDATTLKPLFTLHSKTPLVMSVAFSPDGSRIVTGGGIWGRGKKPGEVKIWDAATGNLICDVKGHEYCVWSVAYSSDGKSIISGAGDWAYGSGEIKVWNAEDGREVLTIADIQPGVHALAISPDGSRITAGGSFGTKMWDTVTGKLILELKGEGHGIRCVAYSRDGKRFATANGDTAIVWDSTTGQKTLTLVGHATYLTGVAFSPDGRTIATSSGDKTARLWDVESGVPKFILKGHTKTVRSVAFSLDGNRLITASDDQTARLWDARDGQEIPTLRGHGDGLTGIAFSPDSQRVATCSNDGRAKIWNVVTNQEILSLDRTSRPARDWTVDGLWSIAFSPDGKRIVVGGQEKMARVSDSKTGELILTIPHDNIISGVAYSPDGTRILTSTSAWGDTSVRPSAAMIWDAETGRQLLALPHPRTVWCVAFSPDGSRIATGSGDNLARVWDAISGQCLLTLKGHNAGVQSVAFSPDGKRIVTASRDNTARVWDAITGNETLTLAGHTGYVRSAVYSPDGQRIVTGSDDASMKLWDAESGQEVFEMHDQPNSVYSVAFSPDGKRIASGITGFPGTVRLWYAPPASAK